MAEGGGGESLEGQGSEFVFDFYCELCKDDGKNVEAEGFCVDCEEYLCAFCYSGHRRSRQTRHHELLDKSQMPKDTPLSEDRVSKDISTKCKLHAGKPIEFYCPAHSFLGCSVCFIINHRNCSGIESILEKSENILNSAEYGDFIQTLKSLEQKSRDITAKALGNITQAQSCYSEVIKSVKRLREEITKTLDKLENDLTAVAKKFESEEEQKMSLISSDCCQMAETIETLLADFQELQSSRRVCQIYISMKESCEQVKTLQNMMRTAEDNLVAKTFKFVPNSNLQNFVGRLDALGNISVEIQDIKERQQATANTSVLVKATHKTDIDVTSNVHYTDYGITGSAVVAKKILMLTDRSNLKVKLEDTETGQVKSELKVSGRPWDVTLISRNQAAVSLRDKSKVLLLHVSDTLTLEREIAVNSECVGVAYTKNRLVLTCLTPPKLDIIDLSGNVMKTIEHDTDGKKLFQWPLYVCISKDDETIYVSDSHKNTVISLTFDGLFKAVYSDIDLQNPRKVCVDHHGNVYVCGYDSKNVHMLTANLNKIQIILTQADGLDSPVYSVSHCPETNRLYVGMKNNKLKVYQLA